MVGRIRSISRSESAAQRAIRLENARRSRARGEHLVPIYVMWTSNVPPSLAQAGLQGVIDVVNASRQNREVVVLGAQRFGNGAFSSGDWYAQEALRRSESRNTGFGPQIDSRAFSTLFYDEPWQSSPHWEVFILNTDLTSGDRDNNFIFGETNEMFPYSVQSVIRVDKGWRSGAVTKEELVRRLLRHGVGHMFGLPRSTRGRDLVESLGTHCTNVCSMRQGLSINEWANQLQQERAAGIHFCGDCGNDLAIASSRFITPTGSH